MSGASTGGSFQRSTSPAPVYDLSHGQEESRSSARTPKGRTEVKDNDKDNKHIVCSSSKGDLGDVSLEDSQLKEEIRQRMQTAYIRWATSERKEP